MKYPLMFCAMIVISFCTIGNAVDGIAVNQAARWLDTYEYNNWPEGNFNYSTDDIQIPGQILRSIITDSKVASLDTIWKVSQGFAKYPVIDITGTRIAFYRYEARIVDGILVDKDKPRHITVTDINGQNMRDVATIVKPATGAFNEGRIFLDWAGDWIYYSAPSAAQSFTPAKIYRVKASDSTTNELVYTYFPNGEGHIDRFTLSLNGKRAAITASWKNYSFTNVITEFPPLYNPAPQIFGGTYPKFGSCNSAVSPSGLMVGSFLDGGHTTVYLNKIDSLNIMTQSGDYAGATCTQMSSWAQENIGVGMGMLRWSRNSEMWYCVMPAGCRAACCGGNQVLVNQWTHETIMITHNQYYSAPPYGGATIVPFSTAGDFWVKGPPGSEGRIQDTLGNWGLTTKASPALFTPASINISGKLLRSYRLSQSDLILTTNKQKSLYIELLDLSGRKIYSGAAHHQTVSIPRALIPRGMVLVRAIDPTSGTSEIMKLSSNFK